MLPLAGSWTLDSFSSHLATLELFEQEPEQHAYRDYRRWAYESAALDLALRQSGLSLGRRGAPRAATGRVRRLDGSGITALDGTLRRVASPLPRVALQARRQRRVERRADRGARRHRRGRLGRLQGAVPWHDGRLTAGRRSVPTCCRGAAQRLARGSGADAGDRGGARGARRARDLGRDHPLGRGHRESAAGRRVP